MSGGKKYLIAPSLLSADFSCLKDCIRPIEPYADLWHIDVMDGHFVPNITLGPFIVKAIKKITKLPLDVHLMIDNPVFYAKAFIDSGADWLTAHIEAFDSVSEVRRFIETVKARGLKVGLSVKPGTEITVLEEYLSELDLVLVMTVEPGFGGQQFMPDQLPKIKWLKENFSGLISVDGGINKETAQLALNAGATVIVAGSYIFNSEDPIASIVSLHAKSNS